MSTDADAINELDAIFAAGDTPVAAGADPAVASGPAPRMGKSEGGVVVVV